jgi:hypothetical protein
MFTVDTSDFDAGVARIEERVDRVSKIAQDMTPLWPKVGELFAEQQRDIFASGSTWQPLEQSTVLKKGSSRVLVETGALMEAATSPIPVEATPLYAKFGVRSSDVPYAHWHARGAGVPKRRPVPPLSADLRRAWLEVVAEKVRSEFAR